MHSRIPLLSSEITDRGHRGNQSSCAGVDRVCEERIIFAHFNDPALPHDHNEVAHEANNGKIMSHEDEGEFELRLHVLEQAQDLCLDRNVQSRGRLVSQNQFQTDHQRARNGRPLALTAAQLVGQLLGVLEAQAHLF